MRAVVIGRHRLLPAQEAELRRLGATDLDYVASLPDNPRELENTVHKWVEKGVKAIIVQALPLRLLSMLWDLTARLGIDLITAEMVTVDVVESEEDAKQLIAERPESRVYVRTPTDKVIRIVEFRGWLRVRKLIVELERI